MPQRSLADEPAWWQVPRCLGSQVPTTARPDQRFHKAHHGLSNDGQSLRHDGWCVPRQLRSKALAYLEFYRKWRAGAVRRILVLALESQSIPAAHHPRPHRDARSAGLLAVDCSRQKYHRQRHWPSPARGKDCATTPSTDLAALEYFRLLGNLE